MNEYMMVTIRGREFLQMDDGRLVPVISGGYGADAAIYVTIAAAVVSAAVSAYGMYSSNQQQAAAMKHNAELAENEAAMHRQAGLADADLHRKQVRRQLATARSRIARCS